jgi:CubicO group peptidase (beta-lactamase class C family)
MRRLSILGLALLLLAVARPLAAVQKGGVSRPSWAGQLDLGPSLARIVGFNGGFGGGLARVASGSGQVLYEEARGAQQVGGAPLTPADSFEIASTSKAFTAACLLTLVEEGAVGPLGIDEKLGNLLPPAVTSGLLVIGGHDFGPELTLRQLLAHTSGLPDYWKDPPFVWPGVNAFLAPYILNPQQTWTPLEILAKAKGLTPIAKPGVVWHYSDTGYVLVGLVIESLTGKPLHEAYRKRLFEPLGLTETWLHWQEPPASSVVESHRYEGSLDMYPQAHNSADWAGGGLVSTTRDLERFIGGLMRGQLFADSKTLGLMTTWVPTGAPGVEYGLGLFRVDLGPGHGAIVGHDGYGNSWMYYWPEPDLVFTGTLNQSENDWWPLVAEAADWVDP